MIDPLHQFEIYPLIPLHIGEIDISLTNSSAFMLLTTIIICLLMHFGTKNQSIIPNKLQVIIEKVFSFVMNLIESYAGEKGQQFFPYILSIFLFILGGNLLGMLPYSFAFTSHIIVTFALAFTVFVIITFIGIVRHGFKFLSLFMPSGIPLYIAPLLIPVEIISYLSRPLTLSVRLFANIFAGHMMLKIIASFAALLAGTAFFPVAILPLILNIAVTGLELFVAVLQAYIFTVLTCVYLHDALYLH